MGGSEREDLLSPTYNPAKQGWEYVTVASEAERTAGRVTPNSALFMTIEGSKADVLSVRRGRMGVYRYAYWQHTKTRSRRLRSSSVAAKLATLIPVMASE
ncbi:hypothetical protein [Streptosporangium sp. V21-05]|uniref:hypothetical protein n=1 Tax=Streptosporangium sp. V21-05 TaxID=3446115 RepID=UPI003F539BFD